MKVEFCTGWACGKKLLDYHRKTMLPFNRSSKIITNKLLLILNCCKIYFTCKGVQHKIGCKWVAQILIVSCYFKVKKTTCSTYWWAIDCLQWLLVAIIRQNFMITIISCPFPCDNQTVSHKPILVALFDFRVYCMLICNPPHKYGCNITHLTK